MTCKFALHGLHRPTKWSCQVLVSKSSAVSAHPNPISDVRNVRHVKFRFTLRASDPWRQRTWTEAHCSISGFTHENSETRRFNRNQAESGIVLGCFQQKPCLPTVGVLALSGGSPQQAKIHHTIQRWTKFMRLAFWKANVQGMTSNGTTNKIEQPRNIPQKEHVAESEVKHVQQTHRSDVAPTHTKSNKNKNTNLIEGL